MIERLDTFTMIFRFRRRSRQLAGQRSRVIGENKRPGFAFLVFRTLAATLAGIARAGSREQ